MITDQLLLGLVVGSFLVYSLAFLLGRQWAAATDREREAHLGETDEDVVRCPNCHTKNERGYRFCRCCVDELPGPVQFARASRTPEGRLIR